MSWNMPPGCSPADYDRWMGYDQPDEDARSCRGDDEYDEAVFDSKATVPEIMAKLSADLRAAKQKAVDGIWTAVDAFGAARKPAASEDKSVREEDDAA